MASSVKIGVLLLAALLVWIVVYYQLVVPVMQEPAPLPGLELTANDTIGTAPLEDPQNDEPPDAARSNDEAANRDTSSGSNSNQGTTGDTLNTPDEEPVLPPSLPPPPETTPYVVKQNDTMQTIAKAWFGSVTKWVLIAQENPLADPMKLRRGQMLRLPAKNARPANIPPALYAELTREIKYTISSGDTLSGIAHQFYGKSNLYTIIFNANRAVIRNPDSLTAGIEITIPRYQQPAD